VKFVERTEMGLLGLLGLFAAAAAWLASSHGEVQESQKVIATVIRVTPGEGRFPRPTVIARTAAGLPAEASVDLNDLHCLVGDQVRGTQTGSAVLIDPMSCRPPSGQMSSTSRP
jgi:hypothetical protein